MKNRMNPALSTRSAVGVQCIACGHVEAPADDLFRCQACGGFDTRPFVADVLEGQDENGSLDLRLLLGEAMS